jgi:type I restriction enzyme S subunit
MGEMTTSFSDNLPKGWAAKKFGEILAEPVRNGIYKKKDFHGRGCKMVNMGELFAYGRISNQEMKRVEINATESLKYLLQDGDLLFARRSLVLEGSGKCSLVIKPSEETTFESSIIRARLDQARANPPFYYYFWDSPSGRARMASIATRTAVSGIRGSDLMQLEVPLPPLPTQCKIATILAAYDDLIENNTRRIALQEEMARRLYREWFVRFRFPGHDSVRLVDSPLGPIPKGWKLTKLGDAIELAYGKALTAGDRRDGPIPVYGSNGIVGHHTESLVKGPGIIVGRKGNVGSVYWSDDDFFPIDTVFYVCTDICLHYVYYNLQTQNFINNDAAVPGLNRNQAYSLPFVLPNTELLEDFQRFADAIFKQTGNLRTAIATLRRTRDLLLPRLISGAVDVSDLDIAMDE